LNKPTSIAQSARDALAGGQSEAKVVGNRDLSGVDDITSLPGIVDLDTFTLSITDEDGVAVNIGAYNGAAAATATITLNANDSAEELIAEINNIHLQVGGAGNAVGEQAFEASLTEDGFLQIKTLNGGDFRMEFDGGGAGVGTDAQNLALAADLGFSEIARLVQDAGVGTNNVEFTALADVALRSYALTNTAGTATALRSDVLSTLRREGNTATALFANLDNATDNYVIGINGGTQQAIDLTNAANTAVTIQDFIDDINNNSSLNEFIVAEFDDATGVLSIRAISSEVQSIEIGVADNSVQTANWGFGRNADLTGYCNRW
jgi:flagellin